jgi:hypothetical protein
MNLLVKFHYYSSEILLTVESVKASNTILGALN